MSRRNVLRRCNRLADDTEAELALLRLRVEQMTSSIVIAQLLAAKTKKKRRIYNGKRYGGEEEIYCSIDL